MGKALKKNQDYSALGYLQWAAWGVVEIEKLERMQRRNYINHVREELKLHGLSLECAGTSMSPISRIYTDAKQEGKNTPVWQTTLAKRNPNNENFKHACFQALVHIDPTRFNAEPHNG